MLGGGFLVFSGVYGSGNAPGAPGEAAKRRHRWAASRRGGAELRGSRGRQASRGAPAAVLRPPLSYSARAAELSSAKDTGK